MEDKIDSIEVGKYAYLVVLDKSPFDVELSDISEIDVLTTMIGGRFTCQSQTLASIAKLDSSTVLINVMFS
jgi:predicted amidohydrolase YtcJ